MFKKYVVWLTDEERGVCKKTIDRLTESGQKARCDRIVLDVDVDRPAKTDRRVAEAFRYRVKTVENVRRRCVLEERTTARWVVRSRLPRLRGTRKFVLTVLRPASSQMLF